jgi:hypothetical protein
VRAHFDWMTGQSLLFANCNAAERRLTARMQRGVVFPQTEIGTDPIAIRDFAQAADHLGCAHLLAFEHVLGVDPSTRPAWSGYYPQRSQFHEPFVLFG